MNFIIYKVLEIRQGRYGDYTVWLDTVAIATSPDLEELKAAFPTAVNSLGGS